MSESNAIKVHTVSSDPGRILALCANESPNLVNLNMLAWDVLKLLVHDLLAAFSNSHAKVHYRIAMDAGNTLNGADA